VEGGPTAGGNWHPGFNGERETMMHGGMGAMMTGMGLIWVLVIAVLVLAVVALLKYVGKG
jgi:hypothetical protein